jgi:hypothetical protein
MRAMTNPLRRRVILSKPRTPRVQTAFDWNNRARQRILPSFQPLHFEEFAEAFGLDAAYGNFGGFFVVHF